MPLQAWTSPEFSRRLRLPDFLAHEGGKVVSPTYRPSLPRRKYSWYSLLLEAEWSPEPQCGRNFNDTIRNRTRDLPTCTAMSSEKTCFPKTALSYTPMSWQIQSFLYRLPSRESLKWALSLHLDLAQKTLPFVLVIMRTLERVEAIISPQEVKWQLQEQPQPHPSPKWQKDVTV